MHLQHRTPVNKDPRDLAIDILTGCANQNPGGHKKIVVADSPPPTIDSIKIPGV